MAKSTPLQIVKDQFGGKSGLVDKIVSLVEPKGEESAEDHKPRLAHVSNAKLLHLVALGEKVQKFGGREGIVKRILELRGQTKDHEFGDKLKTLSLGRVVDQLESLERAQRKREGVKSGKTKAESKPAAKTKAAKKVTAAPAKAGAKKAGKKTAAKSAKTPNRARAAR